jgi:hypothetical protein
MAKETEASDYPRREVNELIARMELSAAPEQMHAALNAHAGRHDSLMKMRSVPLAFTPRYIEPLDAIRWIENGGHS